MRYEKYWREAFRGPKGFVVTVIIRWFWSEIACLHSMRSCKCLHLILGCVLCVLCLRISDTVHSLDQYITPILNPFFDCSLNSNMLCRRFALSSFVSLKQLRMLGPSVHQQCVTSCVHRRTVLTRIFAGKMYVIMVAYIAHNFAAQQTATTLVAVAHLLEELRDPPGFQFCWAPDGASKMLTPVDRMGSDNTQWSTKCGLVCICTMWRKVVVEESLVGGLGELVTIVLTSTASNIHMSRYERRITHNKVT